MTRFDVGQHLHTAGVLQAFIQNDWAGLQVRETQWAISLVERLQEQSRGMTGALRDLPLDWLRGAHERVKGAKSKARRKRRGASKNGVASGADARSNVTKSTDMPPVTAYEDAATEVLEKLWFDIGATVVIITALTQAGAKQCPKLPAYIRAELSVTATEDDAGGAAQWRQVPQFVQFMIEHKKSNGLALNDHACEYTRILGVFLAAVGSTAQGSEGFSLDELYAMLASMKGFESALLRYFDNTPAE